MSQRRLPTQAELNFINAMFEALITGKQLNGGEDGNVLLQVKMPADDYVTLHSFDAYAFKAEALS